MNKIADNFCGYMMIGNDEFVYSVIGQKVTLLPATNDDKQKYNTCNRMRTYYTGQSEYVFGDENGYRIAMLLNSNLQYNVFMPILKFATPVIIRAEGNASGFYNMMTDSWDKFHAITFYGGSINALYNPQAAVNFQEHNFISDDGTKTIKLHKWDKYTKKTIIYIDNDEVEFTLSISQAREHNDKERMGLYSLGELNSFIRFSFKAAQPFSKIERIYLIAKDLISILTRRKNVKFDVYLSQKNTEDKFFKTATWKIFDSYENYSSAQSHQVISFSEIFDCMPELIHAISSGTTNPLLQVLPDNNANINSVSIADVQNLCTALELAYSFQERPREKDDTITKLKSCIKKAIRDFSLEHNIDVNAETTISSCFQYLDYTLKGKILTLYQESKEIIDLVSKNMVILLLMRKK